PACHLANILTPSPSSPLFPYTTLFRSRRHRPRPSLLRVPRRHRLHPRDLLPQSVQDRRAVRLVLDDPLMHHLPVRRHEVVIVPRPLLHLLDRLRERPPAPLLSDPVPLRLVPYPALTHHIRRRGLPALDRAVP